MTDTLIIYYSFTGNSKKVAEYVKNKIKADILELEPLVPFSNDYNLLFKNGKIMILNEMLKLKK